MAANNTNNTMQYPAFNQFPSYGQQPFAQFFPQPQGSVYMINKPEEVSTVPVGTNGVSAAICLSDMVIYLKAMQNGSPMLVGYMLTPMNMPTTQSPQQNINQSNNPISSQRSNYNQDNERLLGVLKNYDYRIKSLESMLQKAYSNNTNNNANNINSTNINQTQHIENGGEKKWEL